MPIPEPEEQVQFLFKLQRLLTEGLFTATYKHALFLALAELAVERGDDSTERLVLDSRDIAEKYIDVYWRQCLPWIPPGAAGRAAGRLTPFRRLLLDDQDGRCFYCNDAIKGEALVDHFVPWARYPQDLGHNFVPQTCDATVRREIVSRPIRTFDAGPSGTHVRS